MEKKINVGTLAVFMYNGVVKKGVVNHVYDELDTILIQVSEEGSIYKVSLSEILSLSEPNDQEEKNESDSIMITPDEFRKLTTEIIDTSPTDSDIRRLLSVFSDLLYYKLFLKMPTK